MIANQPTQNVVSSQQDIIGYIRNWDASRGLGFVNYWPSGAKKGISYQILFRRLHHTLPVKASDDLTDFEVSFDHSPQNIGRQGDKKLFLWLASLTGNRRTIELRRAPDGINMAKFRVMYDSSGKELICRRFRDSKRAPKCSPTGGLTV